MSTAIDAIEIPESKDFHGNPHHPRYRDCDDECYLCGRPVRIERAYQIHTVGGSEMIPVDAELKDDASDTGWWAVGPTCARKIPARYKVKVKKGGA